MKYEQFEDEAKSSIRAKSESNVEDYNVLIAMPDDDGQLKRVLLALR
jgi:hypothetical protein